MRFVLVISEISQNGPSGSRLRIADGLRRRGHDVDVLVLTRNQDPEVLAGRSISELPGAPATYPSGYLQRLRLAFALRRWLRSEENERPIDFLSSSLTSTDRIVHMAGIVDAFHWIHIATSHLLNDARTSRRRHRRQRFFRRLYDGKRVIGVSQGVVRDLARIGARPAESEVIYNAYEISLIRARIAKPAPDCPSEPFLLHVGRFANSKRHDVLFEAYKMLDGPEKLVLLTPYSPELLALIEKYGLAERVMVGGYKENPFPFMAAASAVVLSSDREGFPNVLVEALICGTPVVSTNCPAGPSEILTGDLHQWLSPPGDASALARNIGRVLAAPYEVTPEFCERFELGLALDRLELLASRKPKPSLGALRPFV